LALRYSGNSTGTAGATGQHVTRDAWQPGSYCITRDDEAACPPQLLHHVWVDTSCLHAASAVTRACFHQHVLPLRENSAWASIPGSREASRGTRLQLFESQTRMQARERPVLAAHLPPPISSSFHVPRRNPARPARRTGPTRRSAERAILDAPRTSRRPALPSVAAILDAPRRGVPATTAATLPSSPPPPRCHLARILRFTTRL
jgi:hypothetical protein